MSLQSSLSSQKPLWSEITGVHILAHSREWVSQHQGDAGPHRSEPNNAAMASTNRACQRSDNVVSFKWCIPLRIHLPRFRSLDAETIECSGPAVKGRKKIFLEAVNAH